MNNFLNRLKSGPSLVVLLLIALSFYSSSTTKAHPQTTSLKKNFRPIRSLPVAILEFEGADESVEDENEIEADSIVQNSFKLIISHTSQLNLNSNDSFALFKVPLLFFLFDIPPPALLV